MYLVNQEVRVQKVNKVKGHRVQEVSPGQKEMRVQLENQVGQFDLNLGDCGVNSVGFNRKYHQIILNATHFFSIWTLCNIENNTALCRAYIHVLYNVPLHMLIGIFFMNRPILTNYFYSDFSRSLGSSRKNWTKRDQRSTWNGRG